MSILDIELVGSPGARRSTASRITSPGTITYSRSAAIRARHKLEHRPGQWLPVGTEPIGSWSASRWYRPRRNAAGDALTKESATSVPRQKMKILVI